jgi:hypothetical protein
MIPYTTPVSTNVSYRLAGLPEGFHDVNFFMIPDPYDVPYYDAINSPPVTDWSYMRYHVIAGNATKPEVLYAAGPLEQYVAYQNGSKLNIMSYGPWLTSVPFLDMVTPQGSPSTNVIRSMDVSPGQEIDYYINVKNGKDLNNEQFGRFALLQMLDYEQVPLRQGAPGDVYYGSLGQNEVMAFHASLKAPATPGTHMLSIVLAGYPYKTYDPESHEVFLTVMVKIVLNVKD